MMETDTSSPSNPLANQAAPQQPMGAQQGNPLARLAPQLAGGQHMPQPVPNRAQTTAAVHRFSAVQNAMRAVMEDKDFGKANIRPVLLDEASKLLGSKILSLPEVMNSIKDLPDDPIQQKAFVQNIFNNAQQSEAAVLDHHGAAIASGKLPPDGGQDYSAGNHEQHMNGLMRHYQRV
jgi:hypothetical protein